MPAPVSYRFSDASIRVGDAERDASVAALREHFAAGRLDADEFDERVSAALTARTRTDLRRLFTDLPDPSVRLRGRSLSTRRTAQRVLGLPILVAFALCALVVTAVLAVIALAPWLLLVAVGWFFFTRGPGACGRRPHRPRI
jgi:transposase